MGLMVQVIWELMNLCTIALVLTISGSSGSILQPPAVSPSLPFFSRGQSTSPPPEHALAAAVPAQLHHNSAPPITAETPHGEQPHVSDAERPLASSLPPATFPSHDSALPPAFNAPPAVKPPEAIAPLPNSHSPPFLPLPPLSPPSTAPPFFPSPPLATLPNASPPLPSRAYPPDFVAHSHGFVPLPLMAPLPQKPPPIIPFPSPNASSPLPQMLPPSSSPPNFAQPSHALVPPPLMAPLPPEQPPFFASPPQAMPPYPPTLHPPPIQLDASSPAPQMVPSHSSPNFIAPSHDLVLPPLMEHLPVDPPPIFSSPPQAGPPYSPTLQPPPILPNASSPPPQMVYPYPSPPDFILPPHALAPPPLMEPLPAEPPSIFPSPSQAVPPYPPTSQSPLIPPNAPSPPPQVVPSHPSPPKFMVPSHALVPPPLMEPLPAEPPPIFASPPQVVPQYPPTLSSPPPQMVSSHPSPPYYTVPSHALVPPPLMGPLSPEPPPVFPSLPPNASSSQPRPVPNHPSPPNFVTPSHELVLRPSMEPLPPNPPPLLLSPPPAMPPHATSPPVQWVPPHAMAPTLSMIPVPKEPPSVLPSIPPTMPPQESSPFPHLAPPQGSPSTFFTPPPLTRPPHAFSKPPPVELPHIFPPPPTTLPGGMPPRTSPSAMSPPLAPSPLVMPSSPYEYSHSYAPHSPATRGTVPSVPPEASQRKETQNEAPPPVPASLEPSPSSRISPRSAPSVHQLPRSYPPISNQIEAPNHGAPLWSSNASEPHLPPLSSPAPSNNTISTGVPIAAPPANISSDHGSVTSIAPAPFSSLVHPPSVRSHYSPRHSPVKGISPIISPPTHNLTGPPILPPMPAASSPQSSTSEGSHSSAVSPSPSIHKHPKDEGTIVSPVSVLVPPPVQSQQDHAKSPSPLYAPEPSPVAGQKYNPSSPPSQGSPVALVPSPSPSAVPEIFPVPSKIPLLSPKISPSGSSTRDTNRQLSPPIRALPPPPPNQDCAYLTCSEPFTNTPPGSPCGCVWPMQVGLRLSVPLYTFFPLVSELAEEIASGVFMKQSQVRVMGANSAGEEPEKTIVLVDLVPLNDQFDNITTTLSFQRFWHKQVAIDKSIFGDYDVLYVRYPGLPPSPPMAPSDIAVINGMPYSLRDPNGSKLHPLGVDVPKQRNKHKLSGSLIAVIVFSAIVGVLICGSVAWVLIFKHKSIDSQSAQTPRAVPSLARSTGPTGHSNGSGPSSPLSFGSSLAAYTGSAKTFSASEIEKATDNFNPSGILGEGGFGCVYHGILEDGSSVAVKVLKRDDQQGGREFLAEVEMLSRLHHRNLIKLIGICIDERLRCLVYELVRNGSVDSHLHGDDKETAPLDWPSRLKIALGAARGLAYLHEDSSPRVIHRDFKSSNILLENDFTPKVSDFGLARAALDEENRHISTRVMGTFGYVAPEYAMTGHLLVKSDVYSYGVVLLELLTGRKPVDMSQPPGQENLVTWTRPFLTTKEGLESIIDPSMGPDVPLDSVAKVAAIASMCVQPEVSHRPFMGEVVQALKLVCNECDDNSKDGDQGSRSLSRENLSVDFDAIVGPGPVTGKTLGPLQAQLDPRGHDDLEKGISVSEIFGVSREASGSIRRHSASGPVRTSKGTPRFWQRIRRLSQGSGGEHGVMYRSWARSQ